MLASCLPCLAGRAAAKEQLKDADTTFGLDAGIRTPNGAAASQQQHVAQPSRQQPQPSVESSPCSNLQYAQLPSDSRLTPTASLELADGKGNSNVLSTWLLDVSKRTAPEHTASGSLRAMDAPRVHSLNSNNRHQPTACYEGPASGLLSLPTTEILTPLTHLGTGTAHDSSLFRRESTGDSSQQFSRSLAGSSDIFFRLMKEASRSTCNTAQSLGQLGQDMKKLQMLGQGGCGIVFRAEWKGATVAVKLSVGSGADQLEDNVREALMNKMLAHPHVVHTYIAQLVPVDEEWCEMHQANRQTVSFTARSGGSVPNQHRQFVSAMLGSFTEGDGRAGSSGCGISADTMINMAPPRQDASDQSESGARVLQQYGHPAMCTMASSAQPLQLPSHLGTALPRRVSRLEAVREEHRPIAISSPGNILLSPAATALLAREATLHAHHPHPGSAVAAAAAAPQLTPTQSAPQPKPGFSCSAAGTTAVTEPQRRSNDSQARPTSPCGATSLASVHVHAHVRTAAGYGQGSGQCLPVKRPSTDTSIGPLSGSAVGNTSSTVHKPSANSNSGGSQQSISLAPATPQCHAGAPARSSAGPSGGAYVVQRNNSSSSLDNFSVAGSFSHKRAYTFSEALHLLNVSVGQHISVIVMEHCDRGSLQRAISKGAFAPSRRWGAGTAMRALVRTCREVAQGMAHLHAHGIVHGDLKPANVLLKSSRSDKRGFTARVSDFGHSKFKSSNACEDPEDGAGNMPLSTLVYSAPEAVAEGKVHKPGDVWSFGLLIWQMVTGRVPHAELHWGQVLAGLMEGTLSVEWPESCLPVVRKIGTACLNPNAASRPEFDALVAALGKLEECLKKGGR